MSAVIGIFEEQYKRKKPLSVVKPGTQRRDFTHIDDIVRGCYLTWKKGKQNHYMLGTHESHSILEIAKMGVAILMVEQNAKLALEIANKGYVLVQGKNRYTDSGKALLSNPNVRRSFLGG